MSPLKNSQLRYGHSANKQASKYGGQNQPYGASGQSGTSSLHAKRYGIGSSNLSGQVDKKTTKSSNTSAYPMHVDKSGRNDGNTQTGKT